MNWDLLDAFWQLGISLTLLWAVNEIIELKRNNVTTKRIRRTYGDNE